MPDVPQYPGAPRWVKVVGVIVLILIVLIVILHLAGRGFGAHMHGENGPEPARGEHAP